MSSGESEGNKRKTSVDIYVSVLITGLSLQAYHSWRVVSPRLNLLYTPRVGGVNCLVLGSLFNLIPIYMVMSVIPMDLT